MRSPFFDLAIDHAHQHHHAHIAVKPAVDDHGPWRPIGIAHRGRHLGDDGFQNVVNAHAGFGRAGDGIAGINADHVLDLGLGVVRVGLGQVHLVEHGGHFHPQIQGGVAVGHGLRLDALAGIDHQQSAFAGRQRAADFVRKVHVAGGVDQVQVIDLAIFGVVLQGGRLRLDGDTALFLDVHRVEHTGLHLACGQAFAALDQLVRQGRFAVVNVRNDGEITDVFHQQ